MRAPKILLLMLGLSTCSAYFISSGIKSEVNMFHAFDSADKIAVATSKEPADEHADSDTENDTDTDTDSSPPAARESADETAAAAVASSQTEKNPGATTDPEDTYTKLVAPTIKIKNGMRARLDVAFAIDTTSSMQGEINTVKEKVKSMVSQIAQSKNRPIVRVGLVAYRDIGDDYVTKVYPFSSDIDEVVKKITELMAEGGGDGPEAVDRGLHAAINELDWNSNKKTAKLLFLIGDAPPHSGGFTYDWKKESQAAANKGIHINTIGCDGLEGYGDDGIKLYKQIAQLTNGTYEPLSYQQQIVDTKGNAAILITSGGKDYVMKSTDKEAWKKDIDSLVATGAAAPALQGATNGTIGVQGSDATYVTGVNTAGTVRVNNNLDSVMLKGAESVMSKMGF